MSEDKSRKEMLEELGEPDPFLVFVGQMMEFGKNKYMQTCFACHQAEGQGIPNAFPPLAKSDFLNADVNRAIDIVLRGKTGEITVNGAKYNSVMTSQSLSDDEIANVVAFLASDLASFITGVYIPVCGGNVMPAI